MLKNLKNQSRWWLCLHSQIPKFETTRI